MTWRLTTKASSNNCNKGNQPFQLANQQLAKNTKNKVQKKHNKKPKKQDQKNKTQKENNEEK